MAITFDRGGIIRAASRGDLYDKTVDAYATIMENRVDEMDMFFQHQTTKNPTWKIQPTWVMFDHPVERADTDPRIYNAPGKGYSVEATTYTWSLASAYTQEMSEVDESGEVLGRVTGGLLNAMDDFIQSYMAYYFNSMTSITGSDGVVLASASHPHEEARSGLWSNVHTDGALAPLTFDAMRLGIKTRKNIMGRPDTMEMQALIVGPGNETTARQIVGSEKVPNTATNAIWPWKGTELKVLRRITSTTAFFGWGNKPKDEWGMYYVTRVAPRVDRLVFPSGTYPRIMAAWEVFGRFGFAVGQTKNLHYNVGT